MAAGFRSVLFLLGLAAGAAVVPPPPPPVVVAAEATGGWLTPQQIANLRGWQPVPRRERDRDEALLDAVFDVSEEAEGRAAVAEALGLPLLHSRRTVPQTPQAQAQLAALLATLTPVVATHTQALALADAHRRQALAQDEEALALLLVLLVEEL